MVVDLTSDLQVLAATVDGEAESESLIGKQAVAASILNRTKLAHIHSHFGDGTIRGACLAHAQYDCWFLGADNDRLNKLDFNNPSSAFKECIDVAKSAIAGLLNDPTNGATYYYEPTILGPAWLVGAKWCGQFGTQLFWKDVK